MIIFQQRRILIYRFVLGKEKKVLCYKSHNIAMLPHMPKARVKHIVKLYYYRKYETKDIGTIPPK